MKFARRVFTFAGIYGIVALTPQYLLENWTGRKFPPPITHPEFFYGFVGVVIVFHILFLMIARDPARYRPVMLIAVLEKASFGFAVVVLYLQGRVAVPILGAALFDLLLGVLFLLAWRAVGEQPVTAPAGVQYGSA